MEMRVDDVQGQVCGPGLALALAADYRLCVEGASLCRTTTTLKPDLFCLEEAIGRVSGDSGGIVLRHAASDIIDSDLALKSGLVSTVSRTREEARDQAMTLALKVVHSPTVSENLLFGLTVYRLIHAVSGWSA